MNTVKLFYSRNINFVKDYLLKLLIFLGERFYLGLSMPSADINHCKIGKYKTFGRWVGGQN